MPFLAKILEKFSLRPILWEFSCLVIKNFELFWQKNNSLYWLKPQKIYFLRFSLQKSYFWQKFQEKSIFHQIGEYSGVELLRNSNYFCKKTAVSSDQKREKRFFRLLFIQKCYFTKEFVPTGRASLRITTMYEWAQNQSEALSRHTKQSCFYRSQLSHQLFEIIGEQKMRTRTRTTPYAHRIFCTYLVQN